MIIAKYEDIERIGKLLVEGFSNDPEMDYQLKNVSRKQFILKTIAESQVREFIENAEVYTIDNCKGAMLGYYSKDVDLNKFIEMLTTCNNELSKVLTEEEIETILKNSKMTVNVVNPIWFNDMYEEYYHLMTIVIDKKFRGKGIFRKLIAPLLKESDERRIPILLETHNKANVDIYKHFGFEVVKELADEKLDFKQYCMIRQPNHK